MIHHCQIAGDYGSRKSVIFHNHNGDLICTSITKDQCTLFFIFSLLSITFAFLYKLITLKDQQINLCVICNL